jgi:YHS domain-containing protein
MESILYFLLWAGLFFAMTRFGCGAHVVGHGHHHGDAPPGGPSTPSDAKGRWAAPEKDIDPVCHMPVDTAKAKTAVYVRHVYHFCSQDCRGKFEENPKNYLTADTSTPTEKKHHHAF